MTLSSPVARTEEAVTLRQWYRASQPPSQALQSAAAIFGPDVQVRFETCFNVGFHGEKLDAEETLRWLLAETFEPAALRSHSTLTSGADTVVVEVGPRLNFQTAWSSNAVAICQACGLKNVVRLERSRRFSLTASNSLSPALVAQFVASVHDRMTEVEYARPLLSFSSGLSATPTVTVRLMEEGLPALEAINSKLGLGFDKSDMDLYMKLFVEDMKRNPTNVELFDLAQSNSEHSRHWFFKGRLVIDGEEMPQDLLSVVRDTLRANPGNSVIAFADNSSSIRGGPVEVLAPVRPGEPSPLSVSKRDRDVLFTAETHNFPTGVAPEPGAETGVGGRIRDTAATGVGSLVVGGTAGYSVGNLRLEGLSRQWEDDTFDYPSNLATPSQILVQASTGASDYGNKFGEPLINGFARVYGLRHPNGERREYVKPIMFSGGMGHMDHAHARKGHAEKGLLVVKIGGPAYRVGIGGGAASSMVQGDNRDDLDFDAVQRGDPEMEQKAYRVLRACVELGEKNPIVSIHDQGAGGNCNVVKELIYPAGAKINLRDIWVGDKSLSALEVWGAEYQEQFGLLLRPESLPLFLCICARENVCASNIGTIDGSGRIVVWDEEEQVTAVDMDLEAVLGELPQKTFVDNRIALRLRPFTAPDSVSVEEALGRVLTLMTVGSKRFLTTKVDRSVTGLVAQQQCTGPLQLPVSDAGVLALTMFGLRGSATAIGERPNLTALSPAAMARMTVGEMLTNIACVAISNREDIKCEANWMWAAKLPGDCATLHDAATAMRDVMIDLGIAVDGGKDSLSMAVRTPSETVRAPGTLVVSGYVGVDDVRRKATPDFKSANSTILHVDIGKGRRRLGGSALAQVYGELGDECPDLDDAKLLAVAFDTVQALLKSHAGVLSCHDVSDGGLIVTLLEMGFAGNRGLDIVVDVAGQKEAMPSLFAEELGIVLEVERSASDSICSKFKVAGVPVSVLGSTRTDHAVSVKTLAGDSLLSADIRALRDTWEETSFGLERLQASEETVVEEQAGLRHRTGLSYIVPWSPTPTNMAGQSVLHKVAVVRDEGSNGDREMSAAFHMAGFEPWDVSVQDIRSGHISLRDFRGVVFVGGFSYADVLDSAKGWAGVLRFNNTVRKEFDEFFSREDTFSLGVCNGCQLMALLGRVPFSPEELVPESQPRFIHNKSGRYESRFTLVGIEPDTPAVMLRGMSGAQLGVWVSHGEGRAYFPDETVLQSVLTENLAPIRYLSDAGEITEAYPANPNGSVRGIAALCSRDGRHLAMMPHPERTCLTWQWAFLPREMEDTLEASPWITMFQNAREWCDQTAV